MCFFKKGAGCVTTRLGHLSPVEDLVARLLALGLLRKSNEAVDAVGTRLTASGLTRDLDHAGTWALSLSSRGGLLGRWDSTLSGFQIDQCNAQIAFLLPPQMGRCVNQHHFEGRSNRACEKMATTCRAIG
jgi:hypothetical protein